MSFMFKKIQCHLWDTNFSLIPVFMIIFIPQWRRNCTSLLLLHHHCPSWASSTHMKMNFKKIKILNYVMCLLGLGGLALLPTLIYVIRHTHTHTHTLSRIKTNRQLLHIFFNCNSDFLFVSIVIERREKCFLTY